ncbi:hypothetical protein IFM89_034126 [Coptis chinensis]|uniref:Protein-tyrosine-phosphatase IBR5 n=1 Tax=Coptis chinensis TaxID=261450 RepID=A0A835I4U8_9MAGN|nr:hypothetical protein IFM89_034126 [Coptis chinensis]
MRKRERENPCGICGHYHKYEEGEVCGICGHRMPVSTEKQPGVQASAFPSEILPEFLYLGSYDNASRAELLKIQGISRILNTVPACQNLYRNSFTYHCLQDEKILPFDDAIQFLETANTTAKSQENLWNSTTAKPNAFPRQSLLPNPKGAKLRTGPILVESSLTYRVRVHEAMTRRLRWVIAHMFTIAVVPEQCEKDKARVLVHCMSGKNRSPAIVIAYLMKCKGWRLPQSYQWVKDRRPSVELSQAVHEQLQVCEQKIFGPINNSPMPTVFPVSGTALSGPGHPTTNNNVPPFICPAAISIFDRSTVNIPSHEFTFGAGEDGKNVNPLGITPSNANDTMMDGS